MQKGFLHIFKGVYFLFIAFSNCQSLVASWWGVGRSRISVPLSSGSHCWAVCATAELPKCILWCVPQPRAVAAALCFSAWGKSSQTWMKFCCCPWEAESTLNICQARVHWENSNSTLIYARHCSGLTLVKAKYKIYFCFHSLKIEVSTWGYLTTGGKKWFGYDR